MVQKLNLVLILVLWCCQATAGEQNLFNGKDLTGWDAASGWWSVEDGALTAESTAAKPCKKCNYLIWKGGQPENFELTADFRLSEKANSGIQIRSETRPHWNTYGYQADMTGDGKLVGYVYHHKRGLIAARGDKVTITADGKKQVEKIGDSAKLLKHFQKTDWNRYRIRCDGPVITLYVNDVLMCRITDNDASTAERKGVIGLQMHPGPPMKVQFKNIVLKELQSESKFIAVLKSNAGLKDKTDACRELARLGTARAVPVLASLLSDKKLAHMARYALEPIPSPAVDDALRNTLGRLQGLQLVGVISSIGVRQDEKAVAAISALLKHQDARVSKAAARCLGNIGSGKAAEELEKALKNGLVANRLTVYEALLQCAATLGEKEHKKKAIAIYDSLRNLQEAPRHIQANALRGAIITRRSDGLPLLMEAVRSKDYATVQAAARIALEIKADGTDAALAGELEKLSADRQVLLCNVLGARSNAVALPALYSLAKTGDPAARKAAILAAAEIGDTDAAALFIDLLKDQDKNIVQTAEQALAGLRGTAADDAVIKMLDSDNHALQLKMIRLVAYYRIAKAMPLLAKLMNDKEKDVRLAAIKSYGDIASASDLSALLGKLVNETRPADIAALEKALSSVCSGTSGSAEIERELVATLGKAVPSAKPALLRALNVAGGASAPA